MAESNLDKKLQLQWQLSTTLTILNSAFESTKYQNQEHIRLVPYEGHFGRFTKKFTQPFHSTRLSYQPLKTPKITSVENSKKIRA